MIRRLLVLLLAFLVLASVPASGGQIYIPATIESLTVTGQTVGDLIYADSTSSFTRLADVATGNALISGGVGAAPSWGKIGLTTHVSGTLAYGNGGTGATSYTTNRIIKAGASAFANSLLSDDGTNVTLASGQLFSPAGSASAPTWAQSASTNSGIYARIAGATSISVAGVANLSVEGSNIWLHANQALSWNAAAAGADGGDLFLRRFAAANLKQGTDGAAPVSQYLSVANVSTGTANTAGVPRYIDGAQGTGTGLGGSIILRTAPAGAAGSAQNALSDQLTVASGTATFAGSISSGDVTSTGNFTVGTSAVIRWNSRGYMDSPADGVIRLTNSSATEFSRQIYGTNDGNGISLVKTGTTLTFALGDGTGVAKFGYGVGGTVTQLTSKATGVTLTQATGEITMDAAALAGDTSVTFVLTNTKIAAGDMVVIQHVSGGTVGSYTVSAVAAAGSASITVRNITTGSLSEALVVKFMLFKTTTS